MEQIYFKRDGGRVRRMLAVYSDGSRYNLHFVVLDRTNPTREERAKGIKEKRFETLNMEISFDSISEINPDDCPLPDLVNHFLEFNKGVK